MPRSERAARRDRFLWLACAGGVAAAGLLGWALFWPDRACAQPACARDRFAITIEVDAFGQVPPIDFEVPADGGRVSLQSILRGAGVDVGVELDQLELPYQESSGPLDRADLYQFASVWRRDPRPDASDATVYALLTAGLVSEDGSPLFGIMFDNTDREAFALAPATTQRFFGESEPGFVATLQLRTFVHELLHTLNRHHADAVAMDDGRLTLEAPTRCISRQERSRRDWSLTEAPLMAVAPSTIRFFQTAAPADVLPGRENASFLQRAAPAECEDARARAADAPQTRWELARQRLQRLFSIEAALAAPQRHADGRNVGRAAGGDSATPGAAIDLRIQSVPAAYPLGYPVAVRILARNDGTKPLPLRGRLDPGYGMVSIEQRNAGTGDWHLLTPLAWFEAIDDSEAWLAPGESTEQTVAVYYADQGWVFREPGEYQVRARLQVGNDADQAVSAPTRVRIEAPHTDADRGALKPLLNDDGALDDRVGRLLMFGGRIGAPKDIAPLEKAAQLYAHTSLGAALQLTLVSQRLRRPIDPLTGERPLPDLRDARELIEDTCTDSGVAALRQQLLARHAGQFADGEAPPAIDVAAAWDGTSSPRGTATATYSDAALSPWGPSLHFCFDESELRPKPQAAISRLARQLRREKPQRVVLVGHADHEGACRHNEALARSRAAAVRRALLASGLRSPKIEVVALGERRPIDFASTREAHSLNRRVEILVQPSGDASPAPDAAPQRIMPSCARPLVTPDPE
jgi:outer membrane protein OmpA-like peptidoglycan-associated protein